MAYHRYWPRPFLLKPIHRLVGVEGYWYVSGDEYHVQLARVTLNVHRFLLASGEPGLAKWWQARQVIFEGCLENMNNRKQTTLSDGQRKVIVGAVRENYDQIKTSVDVINRYRATLRLPALTLALPKPMARRGSL